MTVMRTGNTPSHGISPSWTSEGNFTEGTLTVRGDFIQTNGGGSITSQFFASTGTKDPSLPDTLYVSGLAAPDTVNTMPDNTLKAFFDHGTLDGPLPEDGSPSHAMLDKIAAAGIDLDKTAEDLQVEGAQKFDDSWIALLADIQTKTAAMA